MGIDPAIIFGHVMHKRLFPRVNAFSYKMYNIAIDITDLDNIPLPRNRFAPLSFHDRDHGPCDGTSLEEWARHILKNHNISLDGGKIILICMPRVLGYVFNPVSFWLCHNAAGKLCAVLCEVHNTFGERHTYLCAQKGGHPLKRDITLEGLKLFHVSPFLEREGHYLFRFEWSEQRFGAWINFFDANKEQKLVTSFTGHLEKMNQGTIRKAFWKYPLVTFKAIYLIHWQAFKLVWKKIKYIPRPLQMREKVSATRNVTKL